MAASTTTTLSLSTLVLAVSMMLIFTAHHAHAAPSCPDVQAGANTEDTCPNGVVKDWCHQDVCGKGPGESCGGRRNENGMCGRGMFCGCDRCHGCNRALECYFSAKC